MKDEKKILDAALALLQEIYDQKGYRDPKRISELRRKIHDCSTVQLITNSSKRTFADEA